MITAKTGAAGRLSGRDLRLGEPVQPQLVAVRRTLTKTSFDLSARVAAPPASLERRDVSLAKDVCLCLASTKDPKGGFEFI